MAVRANWARDSWVESARSSASTPSSSRRGGVRSPRRAGRPTQRTAGRRRAATAGRRSTPVPVGRADGAADERTGCSGVASRSAHRPVPAVRPWVAQPAWTGRASDTPHHRNRPLPAAAVAEIRFVQEDLGLPERVRPRRRAILRGPDGGPRPGTARDPAAPRTGGATDVRSGRYGVRPGPGPGSAWRPHPNPRPARMPGPHRAGRRSTRAVRRSWSTSAGHQPRRTPPPAPIPDACAAPRGTGRCTVILRRGEQLPLLQFVENGCAAGCSSSASHSAPVSEPRVQVRSRNWRRSSGSSASTLRAR